jgi:hypothetical protein
MKKLTLLLATLFLIPAQPFASAALEPSSQAESIEGGAFLVASDVPPEQTDALRLDLNFLSLLELGKDPALQQVMELESTPTPANMKKWLADRVRYVVSEENETKPKILLWDYAYETDGINFIYPRPASLLLRESNFAFDYTSAKGAASTVMSNIGTSIYGRAKQRHVLAGLEIPGVGMVRVTSPRTGIIKIGRGMFRPVFQNPGFSDTNDAIYSVYRLMVLFHEARHSDGNRESLGFPHTICPLGHDYEGLFGCDLSLNGAYVVGALTLRNFTASCTSCSTVAKAALKMTILDNLSRVIKEGPKYSRDALARFICQKAFDKQPNLSDEQKNACDQVMKKTVEMTKAAVLDSHPEGKREENRP